MNFLWYCQGTVWVMGREFLTMKLPMYCLCAAWIIMIMGKEFPTMKIPEYYLDNSFVCR